MGHIIAGDWKSYQYLVESIRQFPNQVFEFLLAVLLHVLSIPPYSSNIYLTTVIGQGFFYT